MRRRHSNQSEMSSRRFLNVLGVSFEKRKALQNEESEKYCRELACCESHKKEREEGKEARKLLILVST